MNAQMLRMLWYTEVLAYTIEHISVVVNLIFWHTAAHPVVLQKPSKIIEVVCK